MNCLSEDEQAMTFDEESVTLQILRERSKESLSERQKRNMKKVILKTKNDTEKLAKEIAGNLQLGDVIALYGEIGAGKTYFTQKLCVHLGVKENVSSPSYVLMNEYSGKFPIIHLDLYRIEAEEELLELGLHDLFENRVTIIEWAEIAEKLLPEGTKKIRFEFEGSNRIAFVE
jgi:tRNA threonylcarbamoyladenosine biosynthesis protein TsaE